MKNDAFVLYVQLQELHTLLLRVQPTQHLTVCQLTLPSKFLDSTTSGNSLIYSSSFLFIWSHHTPPHTLTVWLCLQFSSWPLPRSSISIVITHHSIIQFTCNSFQWPQFYRCSDHPLITSEKYRRAYIHILNNVGINRTTFLFFVSTKLRDTVKNYLQLSREARAGAMINRLSLLWHKRWSK